MELTWWEKAKLVYEFHTRKLIEHGVTSLGCKKSGWSVRDTAKHFKYPVRSVWIYVKIGPKVMEYEGDFTRIKMHSMLQDVLASEKHKSVSLEESEEAD